MTDQNIIEENECPHKLIHTERLWKKEPKAGIKVECIIEKICVDCGLYLGEVLVHPPPNKGATEVAPVG